MKKMKFRTPQAGSPPPLEKNEKMKKNEKNEKT